jgi:pentatricopeptide repeat protein
VATMYFIKEDLEKQTLYQEKSNELSLKYPIETRITPYQYCADVNNLFRSYMRLGYYTKAEKLLREMMAKTYYQTNLNHKQLDEYFEPILVELRIYLAMGKYRAGKLPREKVKEELSALEQGLPKLQKSIFTNNYVVSQHIAAKLSLLAGYPNDAVYWANKVINETEKTIRPPAQASAKLALLIAHQELGNNTILSSLVASTRRVFEKYKLLTVVETTTFNALQQLLKTTDNKQRTKLFTQLHKQYKAFAKNKATWNQVMQVNLIQWAERNLERYKGN